MAWREAIQPPNTPPKTLLYILISCISRQKSVRSPIPAIPNDARNGLELDPSSGVCVLLTKCPGPDFPHPESNHAGGIGSLAHGSKYAVDADATPANASPLTRAVRAQPDRPWTRLTALPQSRVSSPRPISQDEVIAYVAGKLALVPTRMSGPMSPA
jgi:hypothetical protein